MPPAPGLPGGRPSSRVAAPLVFAFVTVGLLAALFDRTWRHGEVFSPADALVLFYPWAYDTARPLPTNTTRTDEAFYHQPMMVSHWARLKAGDFPEWDPLVLAGTPAFQQGLDVGRAFSPLSVPFYLAPPEVAVTLYGPVRLLVAALLMWAWLRRRGHSGLASAAGGIAWAFNGAFLVWLSAPMPTVALWLPMVLLGVDRTIDSGRPRDVAWLAAGIGLSLLGAYLPTSLAVLAATAAYAAANLLLARPADQGAAEMVTSRLSRARAAARLLVGALAGLALAAVALWPMLATLVASPARERSMARATLPWTNLVTFVMPDFWGSPLTRTWWYPAAGNYPELVTYLGVPTLALAGGGLLVALRAHDRRAIVLAAIAAFAVCAMYGWPPASWLGSLPGFRQMNPYRWNVVLACGAAVLAAAAIDGLVRHGRWAGRRAADAAASAGARVGGQPTRTGGAPTRERHGRDEAALVLGGAVATLLLLGAAAAASLSVHLDDIRRLHLQELERWQVVRFVGLAGTTLGLTGWAVLASGRRGSRYLAASLLVTLLGLDLLSFARGFNPTIPRHRLYPSTPGLERLRAEAGDGRVAPIDTLTSVVPGHVWSVYGIETVSGFDFFGDAYYQHLLARAVGSEPGPPRWDAVDLPDTGHLDLRLLGLLGVTAVVTAPVADVPTGSGYATIGEITSGRRVEQRFESTREGLRAVDVLCATYGRTNAGEVELVVSDVITGRVVGQRIVPAHEVPDNSWLRVEFPPQPRGAYAITVTARGASTGRAITLWATAGPATSATALSIDGQPDPRAIWFRTFATAPDRWPGTEPVYSADLNIYRNPHARPRAWFVGQVEVLPRETHLERLADPGFDLATRAVLAAPLPVAPAAEARVLRVDRSVPDRRLIDVEAPEGGILVVAERTARGWRAAVDGMDVPLVTANSVLLAVAVPPGARCVVLSYHAPTLLPSLVVSTVALVGIALAALAGGRRPRGAAAVTRV